MTTAEEAERVIREQLRTYRTAKTNLRDAVQAAKNLGLDISDIAAEAGVARTTVYRMLATHPDAQEDQP